MNYDKVLLILATFALFCFVVLSKKQKGRKNGKTKLKELKVAPKGKAHGIIFGKQGSKVMYSPSESEGSVGVFSASGTGKTSALGIPTLRSWTGTSISIDISGDICKNCPDMPSKVVFEPENSATTPYNVFAMIDRMAEDEKNEALAQLAILLLPESPNMNDNARFFLENGRKILTAALIAGYHVGLDFCEICKKLVGSDWKSLFNWIDEVASGTDAVLYINGFAGAKV